MPIGSFGVAVTAEDLPQHTAKHCDGVLCRVCTIDGACAVINTPLSAKDVAAVFPHEHEHLFMVERISGK